MNEAAFAREGSRIEGVAVRGFKGGLAACVAVAALFASAGPARAADPPTGISVQDGETAPVFDYDTAIRERVYIPNGEDADNNGVEDRTAIEIMRPKAPGPTLKLPVL